MADDTLIAVEAEARRTVAKMVRALLAVRGQTARDLGRALGMSEASMSDRLRGKTPFTADQVAAVASHFGVPVSTLYEVPAWLRDQRIPGNTCSRELAASAA